MATSSLVLGLDLGCSTGCCAVQRQGGVDVVTNEQGSSRERAALYAAGGALLVTARILVVDLLSGVVDAAAIHGIVVLDAHLVHDATTEAFILRRGTRRLPPPARGPRGADPFR